MVALTDPLADLIIRLKNASTARISNVEIPYSIIKERIVKKLEEKGYIKDVTVKGKGITKRIVTGIAHNKDGTRTIKGVKRVSKPSRRVYIKTRDLYPYKSGYGVAVLSTPKGILVDKEAREKKVGGEVLFYIW